MGLSKVVTAKNLRYAVGELILIVIGILVALAISDWNEKRLQRQEELQLLAEIRAALATDIEMLERNLQSWKETANQLELLIEVLESDPPYDASMDKLFGAAYGLRFANLSMAPYESLKSTGLQTVSNPELRIGIANAFDYHYEALAEMNNIETDIVLGLMRPYFLQNFSALVFHESATPLDYEALIRDQYFHNMMEYRLTNVRGNQIAMYGRAIDDMRAVKEMLDEELGH